MKITFRPATEKDIPLVAWIMLTAARSSKPKGVFDYLIGKEEAETLRYLEEFSKVPTLSICHYQFFQILEVDGIPAAGMACFFPEDYVPKSFILAFKEVAEKFGWNEGELTAAWERAASNYTCFHGYPQQTWNIEFVAVKPEYRGNNFALKLVRHCLELGRKRGARNFQIQVFMGNTPAYKTYLDAGFKVNAQKTAPSFEKDYGYEGLYQLTLTEK